MCCPTDEEAIAIQGKNFKRYTGLAKDLFRPWLEGEVPKSYEHVVNTVKEMIGSLDTVSAEDLVAAGGAAIGSPETLVKMFTRLADAGVDEVLLFMQSFDTPHEKILESIELIATEVMPKVNDKARSR
jgi:alkanesulfonate monooxygenase SsuD/methylene tetrahydromethanopterin reductase-like flavin-dependent oxidoreductase (luciferase family)